MTHTTSHNLTQPMMASMINHNAKFLAASEHLRRCINENADAAASDYKLLFERLQKTVNPQQIIAIAQNHFQSRVAHTVKCWNDMRIAVTESQHDLLSGFQNEISTASGKHDKHASQADPSLFDAMNSAFDRMAEMTQDTLVSEAERVVDEATQHKDGRSKHAKSQPGHHADGRV